MLDEKNPLKKKVYIVIEILVAIMVMAAWLLMMLNTKEGEAFALTKWYNLKFFTVLSNLFAGFTSVLCVIFIMHGEKKENNNNIKKQNNDTGQPTIPIWLVKLRYIATSCVLLTFLTVLLILGPFYGHSKLYINANLWFHLIIPITSTIGWCLLPIEERLSFHSSFLTFLPVIAYALFYCLNIFFRGMGEKLHSNDWYGIFNWGLIPAIIIFSIMLLGNWGVALLLRLACKGHEKEKTEQNDKIK